MVNEKICAIKNKAIELLEIGLQQDISDINSKELYELMDIIKDAEETIKYSEEANYYHKITDTMDKSDNEEIINQYNYRNRMHYSTIDNGKSVISRKIYMDHKDSDTKMKDMEQYISDLGDDITEMIVYLSPTEKQIVKQKITGLSTLII